MSPSARGMVEFTRLFPDEYQVISEERRATAYQAGYDNQADLDASKNMVAFYDLIEAQGGTRLTAANTEEGSVERDFVESLAMDAMGPMQGGTPWRAYDEVGRELSRAIAEGVVARRLEIGR